MIWDTPCCIYTSSLVSPRSHVAQQRFPLPTARRLSLAVSDNRTPGRRFRRVVADADGALTSGNLHGRLRRPVSGKLMYVVSELNVFQACGPAWPFMNKHKHKFLPVRTSVHPAKR